MPNLALFLPTLAVNLPFLDDLVILFAAAVIVAMLCYRLHVPPIVGFLIAGILIGPNALALIAERELVDVLAEIGVILLLFSIGVEFSLERISRLGRAIFVGGGLQVSLTVVVVTGLLLPFGVTAAAGVYTGLLVSLSSTAIVLGLLADRREMDTPAGGLVLAVLIFQDLAVVLMVLLVPALAGEGGGPIGILLIVARALGLIAVTLLLSRKTVPWLLERVARTRRPELFMLTVVSICFGIAAISGLFGVSLALGAFLAGLVVSESRFRDQALSDVMPLRILFNAVFFVSVGMLLDVGFVFSNPGIVLAAAAGALLIKFGAGFVGLVSIRYPVRIATIAAASVAQIGEFAFVLERAGAQMGLTPAG
ncbi:MAG: sodium:proton exchanger, partial [Rhodothermales bacterium]|nr:sodium:proton exchanger [Rhodothermales bacterium]